MEFYVVCCSGDIGTFIVKNMNPVIDSVLERLGKTFVVCCSALFLLRSAALLRELRKKNESCLRRQILILL
jgi:ABC-type dipeptide/oligopeptide/nickel transport system permease component